MSAQTVEDRPMRVIVCGGRDYVDAATVGRVFSAFHGANLTVVHGAARGADTMASNAAHAYGLGVEKHPADWKKHGRAAGPIRNQAMLDLGADLVIAFPGGRGTEDMVGRAKRAGIPVMRVECPCCTD